MSPPERLDQYRAVVEHTETGGPDPRRVMQAGDGHEGAAALTAHDHLSGPEGRADHRPGGVENARERRGIAEVEEAFPGQRHFLHELHVMRRVEKFHVFPGGVCGVIHLHMTREIAFLEAPQECVVTIGAEGMSLTEAISGDRLAGLFCGILTLPLLLGILILIRVRNLGHFDYRILLGPDELRLEHPSAALGTPANPEGERQD